MARCTNRSTWRNFQVKLGGRLWRLLPESPPEVPEVFRPRRHQGRARLEQVFREPRPRMDRWPAWPKLGARTICCRWTLPRQCADLSAAAQNHAHDHRNALVKIDCGAGAAAAVEQHARRGVNLASAIRGRAGASGSPSSRPTRARCSTSRAHEDRKAKIDIAVAHGEGRGLDTAGPPRQSPATSSAAAAPAPIISRATRVSTTQLQCGSYAFMVADSAASWKGRATASTAASGRNASSSSPAVDEHAKV